MAKKRKRKSSSSSSSSSEEISIAKAHAEKTRKAMRKPLKLVFADKPAEKTEERKRTMSSSSSSSSEEISIAKAHAEKTKRAMRKPFKLIVNERSADKRKIAFDDEVEAFKLTRYNAGLTEPSTSHEATTSTRNLQQRSTQAATKSTSRTTGTLKDGEDTKVSSSTRHGQQQSTTTNKSTSSTTKPTKTTNNHNKGNKQQQNINNNSNTINKKTTGALKNGEDTEVSTSTKHVRQQCTTTNKSTKTTNNNNNNKGNKQQQNINNNSNIINKKTTGTLKEDKDVEASTSANRVQQQCTTIDKSATAAPKSKTRKNNINKKTTGTLKDGENTEATTSTKHLQQQSAATTKSATAATESTTTANSKGNKQQQNINNKTTGTFKNGEDAEASTSKTTTKKTNNSSNKENINQQNINNKGNKGDPEKFSIKTGLRRVCLDNIFFMRINDDVLIVSRLSIKTTLFVDYCLRHPTNDYLRELWSTEGPNFLQMCYFFKDKIQGHDDLWKKQPFLYDLFLEFLHLKENDQVFYNCTHRGRMIEEMALDLDTNFSTNLRTHAPSRIRKLFNYLWDVKEGRPRTLTALHTQTQRTQLRRRQKKQRRVQMNRKKRAKWQMKKEILKNNEQEQRRRKKPKKYINRRAMRQRRIVYGRIFGPSKKTTNNEEENNREKGDQNDKPTKTEKTKSDSNRWNEKRIWVEKKLSDLLNLNVCEEEIFKKLNAENLDFRRVSDNDEYHKFIPFFHRLQNFFCENHIKSFVLVPTMKLGRKHIRYTNTGLRELQAAVEEEKYFAENGQHKPRAANRSADKVAAERDARADRVLQNSICIEEKTKLFEIKKEKWTKLKDLYKAKKARKADKNFCTEAALEITKLRNEIKKINEDVDEVKEAQKNIHAELKENKKEKNDELWSKYFCFNKLLKKVRKRGATFSGTITTNGIDVSVIFNRKQGDRRITSDELFKFTRINTVERVQQEYKVYKGCDPGLNLAFAGVERRDNPQPKKIKRNKKLKGKKGKKKTKRQDCPFRIKSATFRWQIQEQKRESFRHRKSRNYRKDYYSLLNKKYHGEVSGKDPRKVEQFIRYRLEAFTKMQPFEERRNIARLSWDKFMVREREVDFLANHMINERAGSQLLVMGQPEISPWMKGHRRMALQRVVRRIVERSKVLGSEKLRVIFVNEHNTTQMCSTCNVRMDIRRNRTAYCSSCGVTWNRDVNAGRNILNIGLIVLGIINRDSIPHPEVFNALKVN